MVPNSSNGSEIASPDLPDLYKTIFRQSSTGIEIYDSNGSLVDANAACLDIFGVSDFSIVKNFGASGNHVGEILGIRSNSPR